MDGSLAVMDVRRRWPTMVIPMLLAMLASAGAERLEEERADTTIAPTSAPASSSGGSPIVIILIVVVLCCCFNCCCSDGKCGFLFGRRRNPVNEATTVATADAEGGERATEAMKPVRTASWGEQLSALIMKKLTELSRSPISTLKMLVVPVMMYFFLWLFYYEETDFVYYRMIRFIAPLAFYTVLHPALCTTLVAENAMGLKPLLRMMGLRESVYWVHHQIWDALLNGVLCGVLTWLSSEPYDSTDYGDLYLWGTYAPWNIFWLLFLYCLAAFPFNALLCRFTTDPQSAAQLTVLVHVASWGYYTVFKVYSYGKVYKQMLCFVPPLAFSLGIQLLAETDETILIEIEASETGGGAAVDDAASMVGTSEGAFGTSSLFVWSRVLMSSLFGPDEAAEEGLAVHPRVGSRMLSDDTPFSFSYVLFMLLVDLAAFTAVVHFVPGNVFESMWDKALTLAGLKTKGSDSSATTSAAEEEAPLVSSKAVTGGAEGDPNFESIPPSLAAKGPSVFVDDISHSYGTLQALKGFTGSLFESQIFALLGPNGAGKSTLMSILCGQLSPTSGTKGSTVLGAPLADLALLGGSESSSAIGLGVCMQHDVLFDNLTVRDHLYLFARIKGVTPDKIEAEVVRLMNHLEIAHRADYLPDAISGGMKRKLCTAMALIGNSRFVVLDEPSAGMDPVARRSLWSLLKQHRAECKATIMLCTHYMDEAEHLGDRVAILAKGSLKCVGSSDFLKQRFGVGYYLTLTRKTSAGSGSSSAAAAEGEGEAASPPEGGARRRGSSLGRMVSGLGKSKKADAAPSAADGGAAAGGGGGAGDEALRAVVTKFVPGAVQHFHAARAGTEVTYILPFESKAKFGDLMEALQPKVESLGFQSMGLSLSTLDEVFMRAAGYDHWDGTQTNVAAGTVSSDATSDNASGLDAASRAALVTETFAGRSHFSSAGAQITAIARMRLLSASHDWRTLLFVGIPLAVCVVTIQESSSFGYYAELYEGLLFMVAFFALPSMIASRMVNDRVKKVRGTLAVMGCSPLAYFVGNLIGDWLLFSITLGGIYVDFLCNGYDYVSVWLALPIFGAQLITWSYAASFLFTTPRQALMYMPALIVGLWFLPAILITVTEMVLAIEDVSISTTYYIYALAFGYAVFTPLGSLFVVFVDSTSTSSGSNPYPDSTCLISIMAIEIVLCLLVCMFIDRGGNKPLTFEPTSTAPAARAALDEDVVAEHDAVDQIAEACKSDAGTRPPILIEHLRKLYPGLGGCMGFGADPPVRAVKDFALKVEMGEIFGLLGVNGAGKTTLVDMLTRIQEPTSGDAHLMGHSVLNEFQQAAESLGVVTQENSLCDLLSCREHLLVFAMMRGVPLAEANAMADALLKLLGLEDAAERLACQLSGGMKRRLVLGIALIADPEIALLDEVSAGLDPLARYNIWQLLIATCKHRAVILTTHSMAEAEALCTRIGIMVQGQLRCVGSPQHLKAKFGSGYTLRMKKAEEEDAGSVVAWLESKGFVAETTTVDRDVCEVKFAAGALDLGRAFKELEAGQAALGVVSYSITQPSLDDVFNAIVAQATDEAH